MIFQNAYNILITIKNHFSVYECNQQIIYNHNKTKLDSDRCVLFSWFQLLWNERFGRIKKFNLHCFIKIITVSSEINPMIYNTQEDVRPRMLRESRKKDLNIQYRKMAPANWFNFEQISKSIHEHHTQQLSLRTLAQKPLRRFVYHVNLTDFTASKQTSINDLVGLRYA